MGGGYDRLGPSFCAAELEDSNMVLRDRHPITCFLIVEHTSKEALIRKQVLRLLLANCGWLYFYGRHEPLWHWIADETFVRLHPSSNDETCCCTVDCPDIDDFVNELYLSVSAGSNVPHVTLLLYDDAGIYKDVLERLESLRAEAHNNCEADCTGDRNGV